MEKLLIHSCLSTQLKNLELIKIPFFNDKIPAGFPSPATDFIEADIDLSTYLAPNPLSTIIVRVVGNSMIDAYIPNNAILIIDKSIKPKHNQIIVASINGDFTVKRLILHKNSVWLKPENKDYKPILINDEMDFRIWGVVSRIVIDANSI